MPLSHIINCSLLTGIVPSDFKIAKVVPIYKNGKRHSPYNYCPASMLHSFSKIVENVIANRLFFSKKEFCMNINLDLDLVEI